MSHNSNESPDTLAGSAYARQVQQTQSHYKNIHQQQMSEKLAPALVKPTVVGVAPVFDGITSLRQN